MPEVMELNDQPISATFFGVGKWLTDFIEPDALEVQSLYASITEGITDPRERAVACWEWVANNVRYVPFVRGKLEIHGKISVQQDCWVQPSITIQTRVGNCAVKSFLLTSLLRNFMSSEDVYCVLGNLYDDNDVGGHAWVQVQFNGEAYVMEATRPDIPAMIPTSVADRYEPVHFFNDQKVWALEGKTSLQPFKAWYSEWLKDYLDWAYINGGK